MQTIYHLKIHATDCGIPPHSTTFNLVICLDPTLPPTSLTFTGGLSNGGQSDSAEALSNIYLIIIIAFGVSVAFIVLMVAICLMSKGHRLRRCCPPPAPTKATQISSVDAVSFCTPGSSQLPDHSSPMFTNGADFMTNAGSASYALEKGSPLQCTQSEGGRWENVWLLIYGVNNGSYR